MHRSENYWLMSSKDDFLQTIRYLVTRNTTLTGRESSKTGVLDMTTASQGLVKALR